MTKRFEYLLMATAFSVVCWGYIALGVVSLTS